MLKKNRLFILMFSTMFFSFFNYSYGSCFYNQTSATAPNNQLQINGIISQKGSASLVFSLPAAVNKWCLENNNLLGNDIATLRVTSADRLHSYDCHTTEISKASSICIKGAVGKGVFLVVSDKELCQSSNVMVLHCQPQ